MSDPFPELNPTGRPLPPAPPPASMESWLGQEMRRERDNEIKQTIVSAPPPDQVARATVAARQTGLPPLMVDGRLDEVTRSQNADALNAVAAISPALGIHLVANPRTAIAAQDDAKSLGVMGSIWDTIKKLPQTGVATWNSLGVQGAKINHAIADGLGEFGDFMTVLASPNSVTKAEMDQRRADREAWWKQGITGAEQRLEVSRPAYTGPIQRNVLQGVENLGPSAVALAAGVASRNPNATIALMGVQTGLPAYSDARVAGRDIPTSLKYGVEQGAIEAITEKIPASHLVEAIVKRTPFGKSLIRQLGEEIPGEQLATVLQDFSEWATLHPDRPFSEYLAQRPSAALDTLIQTVSGTSVQTAAVHASASTARAAASLTSRFAEGRRAKAEGRAIDRLGQAAEQSKLRGRDAEGFRALVQAQAEDAGATGVHIPGQAVQEFMQSDSYDGEMDRWSADVYEAASSGGDIVIPVQDALTDLVGTKAWEALKPDMRLSAGGISPREAATFEEAMADHLADLSERMDKADAEQKAQRTVVEKLTDKIALQLGESYTAPAARTMAEVTAQYLQTRAARMGQELTGNELDSVEIKQVLPEALAAARKADATDLVINALRKGKAGTTQNGPTLAEWIAGRGGVNDTGGDLASMGVGDWHKQKAFRKKLLRNFDPTLALGGISGEGDFGIDTTLRAAIEAGYFPDLAGVEGESGPSALDTQALLDALSDELAGQPRYAQDASVDPMRAAAEELKQMLDERGLDPDAMSDAELRAAIDRMAEEGPAGGLEQEARGRIQFDAGQTLIELFQSRNLSTFFHEMGHMALENLRTDASLPDAPDTLKADWQTVSDWFAANGHPITDGIPTEAHELWARGFERYLMEGKAPSQGLKRIFETIRSWMISIYKTVDRLRSPITPEIREVMDRLIATDEEIEAARETQALQALFSDAASVGMSKSEFAAYQDQITDARTGAYGKMVEKTLAAIRARETKKYREDRKGVRDEIEADVLARPLYKALANLKASPINEQWVKDELGADALSLLPKRVPPVVKPGGAHPDSIAEVSGYASGRDMIEALIGAEMAHRQAREGGDQRTMRERTVETETDAEMTRRYGDPLGDGTIEREALAAVHNEKQGDVIAAEIRVLARQTGRRPTPYALARDWARNRVRSGKYVDEASPAAIQRHARNAAKAGRAAEAAMLARDADEAFRQKQLQMLQNALVAEATAAQDEVLSAQKRLERVAKARTMKSVDQDYLEQAQALLEQVELRERTQRSLDRQASFAEWAAAREAEGYDVVVPASFGESLGTTHWTRLPVDQFLALDETVAQIMHLGRLKQTLLDGKEQREFDAIVSEAVSGAGNIKGNPPKGLDDPTFGDGIRAGVAGWDAALLKMETVFDWMDGGNANGVFNRVAFRPIADAQAREAGMLKDYYGRIKALFEGVDVSRWHDKVSPPFTDPFTGKPVSFQRQKLIAMALNIGNEGNLQRLSDGYGWNAQAIEEYLASELTAEEWGFVQGVWDTIDTLWPELSAMERRINGVEPDKVEAREVVTPHGTMRGGYYPAIYDSSLDLKTEERRGRESDLFEGAYTRASTRASATKERASKVRRPIHLDLGVINRHLGEVIHDVTHREPVMAAYKFLTNERVASAVEEALGPEVRKMMRPWVKFVANSWAMERAGNEGFGKWLGKLRANATAVGLGLRATTMVTQIAGLSNSIEVVGESWIAKGVAQFSAHPVETFRFVMDRSDEVRHRMDTLDRDLRTEIARVAGNNPITKGAAKLDEAKVFMFHGIGLMDRAVSIPTWIGAYNKALAEGSSEEDAAYAGDKAVRLSQGAGAPKDLAAIQRGTGKYGEALKLITMFYSYFSAMYQRQRTLARDIGSKDTRKPRNLPRVAARAFWLLVVPPLLVELLKVPLGAGGPDDDEWWAQWVMRKLLSNSLGGIPLARDVFEPTWNAARGGDFFAPTISPVNRALSSVVNVGKDAGKVARGEGTKHATKDVLEAAGYVTGLVPGQVANSTQFLVDVGSGDADPETMGDWLEGLASGKLEE